MMNDKKALLIIDMQKGTFMPEFPCFDTNGVVNRINLLSGIFRDLSLPVIIIQHDGTKTNEYIPDTPAWELLDELEVRPGDIVISKCAHDSFYETELQSKLAELNVRELVITGAATDFCVESTVQSAISRDYNVTVVEDAHTTTDKPHLEAGKLIAHYNWLWSNFIPTRGRIEVASFEAISKRLADESAMSPESPR